MTTLELPEEIRLPQEEIEAYLERVEKRLGPQDHAIARAHVEGVQILRRVLEHKGLSIDRLKQLLFGSSTETQERVLPQDDDPEGKPPAPERKPRRKRRGHGRNGAEAYPGAREVEVTHATLKTGDACPCCKHGKIYDTKRPTKDMRFRAQPPVEATLYRSHTLRCSCCGELFRGELPKEAGEKKYDETVGSIIALLKYGSGMPFYRLEKLQAALGVPLPSSTQWEIAAGASDVCLPVWEALIVQAAQGELFHNDDTGGRILEIEKEIREARERNEEPERTGIYTTGVVSKLDGREITLFFTGLAHAGENLGAVLEKRDPELNPPIQMSDGLSHNSPKGFETLIAQCLVHGRRRFVELVNSFPREVRHVLTELGRVYRLDARVKRWGLSPEKRLWAHQKYSKPVMDALREWLDALTGEKRVEPNSTLGDAINYLLKRWEALTLFLRKPGAPLDNTLVERALKMVILNRKNAYYYRSRRGARVGDIFMSLISTARSAGVNPFEYLTALQRHPGEVESNPEAWLPWNYESTLAELDSS